MDEPRDAGVEAVASCHHVTYEFLKEQDAACEACVGKAIAAHTEAAVKGLRESLELGTPERIFVGLMDECEKRGIGSRYAARHVVSQIMQHIDDLTARLAAAITQRDRLDAALEEAYDLYDAGESAASAYERGDLGECHRQHERAEGIKERMREAQQHA